MSNISVDYDVLNQRGSPAWFSDVYANIPTAGYKGRMFISTDTYAFYRDTGTGWDLIGGPGTGTITGSGATGQVSFFNGSSTLAGNNNLFWDNTNSRLGINTTTPGQPLDIHSTGNTLVQLNNTSTGNSNISFQNQNVAKWRVGNVYNAGANSFDIQNAGLSTNAISISAANLITTSSIFCNTSLTSNGTFTANSNINITNGAGITVGAGYNVIASDSLGFFLVKSNSVNWAYLLLSNLTAPRNFTFPDTTGTLALTSDLSSYLPLAGGTLTGDLFGTNAKFTGLVQIGPTSYNLAKLNVQGLENTYILDCINGTEGNWKLRVFNNGSGLPTPRIVFKYGLFFDAIENSSINFYRGATFSDGYLALSTAGVDRINISNGGYVGINNANTTYNLDVTGTLRTSASSYFATSSGSVGIGNVSASYTLDITGTLRSTSSAYFGTTSGSVGIGNTNPLASLDIYLSSIGAYFRGGSNSTARQLIISSSTTTNPGDTHTIDAQSGTGNLIFSTISTNRMQITDTGSILFGTTGVPNGTSIYGSAFVPVSLGRVRLAMASSSSGSVEIAQFFNPNGQVGNISTNGLITVYGTSSDYRLKKDIEPMQDALSKVNLLKPSIWKWKDNNNGQGFIAHELQEIFPEAVSGQKDGFDEDGKIQYQSVDASFLVATLTAAIQELNEKLIRNNIN